MKTFIKYWYIWGILLLLLGWKLSKFLKQKRCAKETGFNLQDLNPKATTNTMGMNKDKFLACMTR